MSANEPMPHYELADEYPLLWAASKAVDDAERLGHFNAIMPLHREIDTAMRELWEFRRARAASSLLSEPGEQ